MSKFKTGDRVAVYHSNSRGGLVFIYRSKGTVECPESEDIISGQICLMVRLDDGNTRGFHIKQCRILPKKLKQSSISLEQKMNIFQNRLLMMECDIERICQLLSNKESKHE